MWPSNQVTPPPSSVSLFLQGGMPCCQFPPLHHKQAGDWTCHTCPKTPRLCSDSEWLKVENPAASGRIQSHGAYIISGVSTAKPWILQCCRAGSSQPPRRQETLDLTFGESNPILAVFANHQPSNSNTSCPKTQRCKCCFLNQNKFHYFSFN